MSHDNRRYTPPAAGDVLEFPHERGPMHLLVLGVHVFRETYDPDKSMWAVTARVIRHHKRRWVGREETWHLQPGEFTVLEPTYVRKERLR